MVHECYSTGVSLTVKSVIHFGISRQWREGGRTFEYLQQTYPKTSGSYRFSLRDRIAFLLNELLQVLEHDFGTRVSSPSFHL